MLKSLVKKSLPVLLLATAVSPVSLSFFNRLLLMNLPMAALELSFRKVLPAIQCVQAVPISRVLGLGSADLYVAAWNDPDPGMLSEVTILITPPNDLPLYYGMALSISRMYRDWK